MCICISRVEDMIQSANAHFIPNARTCVGTTIATQTLTSRGHPHHVHIYTTRIQYIPTTQTLYRTHTNITHIPARYTYQHQICLHHNIMHRTYPLQTRNTIHLHHTHITPSTTHTHTTHPASHIHATHPQHTPRTTLCSHHSLNHTCPHHTSRTTHIHIKHRRHTYPRHIMNHTYPPHTLCCAHTNTTPAPHIP